ncbi:hypothetical protein J1N35_005147 [Gossypium stocksii]|uniref:RNase H type-1 domain-containing protein n=1 Tax=Gossypium stocksii TaxID=47602 RepID=A0A9D3WE21_9ROSI|nr:hypothetical protein J1N35_005147 [Gossypium stocksii]
MLVILDELKQRVFSVSLQDWLILNLCFHEIVKVASCWARQYELHRGGHKNNSQRSNLINNLDNTWVYLSIDGAVSSESWNAASGGVAQDHDRNWIVGFTRFLGVCSPFEVEVWVILDGILILLNKGYRRIIIMSDNLEGCSEFAHFRFGRFKDYCTPKNSAYHAIRRGIENQAHSKKYEFGS